ncbi:PEP-CTERM sorting domain-containing protein [Opitutaceae bacterium TAV4]|nr:PEP-CTERM sorting domain-containing protein [Opitutaceae bacterium TAV4]RRK01890.1 PEP-CTERM sorting domain-containing protein [Opitutaceae bacterium TAV3]
MKTSATAVLATLVLAATTIATAADIYWNSAADGNWSTATNWSDGTTSVLPGAADTVTIAATTGGTDPYTVTFGTGTETDATLTANSTQLVLGSATAPRATLHLKGGTLTLDTGASTTVLTMANASLNVGTGATLYLRTSDEAGTAGLSSLLLNGNATVTVGGTLTTEKTGGGGTNPRAGLSLSGASGTSNTFTVNSGGTARFGYSTLGTTNNAVTGSSNAVLVDGGSLWFRSLNIGVRGEDNSVTVRNSGTLTIGGSGASIGGGSSQSGTGQLIIGERSGDTVISEGTVVNASSLTLGTRGSTTTGTGGTGTLTLNAGSFTTTAGVTVGGGAAGSTSLVTRGTINVHGGLFTLNSSGTARTITVSGLRNTIGYFNITGGEVNITSAQGFHTLTLAPNVTADDSGTGELNLSGGTLNVDKLVSATDAGTINFTGGLFTVKQATVTNGKAFTVGDGSVGKTATLRLLTGTGSGDHTFADGLVISANARLEGAGKIADGLATLRGTLAATGALEFADGLTLIDGSTLDLNNASGSVTISGGALTIASGATINVSLASFTAGEALTLFSIAGAVAPTDLDAVNFTLNGEAVAGAWNGANFQITPTAIPEPATIALLFGGTLLFASFLLKRRARAAR